MQAPLTLVGPRLKAERAEHHINELERIFAIYNSVNQKTLSPESNSHPWQSGAPIGASFPPHTPTVLGDALHNLRAALDHAYCILIKANGGTVHERSFFPIVRDGRKVQDFKGSIEGHKKLGHAPSDAVVSCIFDTVQPYVGGDGEDLVKLHELDIADKHVILLPTQQRTEIVFLETNIGQQISGLTIIGPGGGGPALTFEAGITPKAGNQNHATFTICFGEGQPYEGEPIIPVLRGLLAKVRSVLTELERT